MNMYVKCIIFHIHTDDHIKEIVMVLYRPGVFGKIKKAKERGMLEKMARVFFIDCNAGNVIYENC